MQDFTMDAVHGDGTAVLSRHCGRTAELWYFSSFGRGLMGPRSEANRRPRTGKKIILTESEGNIVFITHGHAIC